MRIPGETPPPAEADAVVIGGGIVGVSAAYFLAKQGLRPALLEKGAVGAEQSSRNWGWRRQQNRDARELDLAIASQKLWEEIAAELGPEIGLRRSGLLFLSNDPAQLARWARWRAFAAERGVRAEMLSAREASARGAAAGRGWAGGVWAPTDGSADPARAAPMIALGAVQRGASLHQGCAARGIETEAGAVSGVVTEKGVIKTRRVVLAAGAWASSFCRQIGLRFPQASGRATVALLEDVAGVPDALRLDDLALSRRPAGLALAIPGRGHLDPTPQQFRFWREFLPLYAARWRELSPGGLAAWGAGHETAARWALDRPTPMERMRALDPRPAPALVREILRAAARLVPALAGRPAKASWAGYIDMTPDGIPVIDPAPGPEGFLLAAGFSGHGFGVGPGAGRLIADLLTGAPPLVDPAPFRLSRFQESAWGKVAEF